MKDSKAKAPGKLYIAGEHAVVTPGHPAIVIAVDRFIEVSITESSSPHGSITSSVLSSETIEWKRDKNRISLEEPNAKSDILLATLNVTEQYLRELQKEIPNYHIHIVSHLADYSGRKYGLGSSGAVTIATIRALLQAFSVEVSDKEVYKLAALAHLSLDSNGSFGDLAAAAYTGWLAYSSFDKKWVKDKMNTYTFNDLISLNWPNLLIRRLTLPKSLNLLIGWTGMAASTEELVGSVQINKETETYAHFLQRSKECIDQLIIGFETNNDQLIYDMIIENRQILLNMSETNEVVLETPALKTLCSIALRYGAAAKFSGAGGGDCGIAILNSHSQKEKIVTEWEKNDILSLSLTVFTK